MDAMFAPSLVNSPVIPGPRPRVALLASGAGTNLAAIARAVADGELAVDLAGLVCNVAGAGALDVAARYEIPSRIISHLEYDDRASFDAAVLEALRAFDAEWVVMAGWMRLVTPAFLEALAGRVLNIHPSLLPAFRGLRAVEQALAAGVAITGCTVHLVEPEVDSGPIIAQAAVPIEDGDDAEALHARIQRAEHKLYPAAIAIAIARARETSR